MVGRRTLAMLAILALCLAGSSCKKLDADSKPTGPLTYERPKFPDAIPQEYGNLIGVTQSSTHSEWSVLWFQRADGTITVVPVNGYTGKFGDRVMTILRR